MNYKDILDMEDGNRTRIYLHLEGKFLRAYNQSAFLFWDRITRFKLTRRFVKAVNTYMIYLGFPIESKGKWLRDYKLEQLSDKLYLVEPGGKPIEDTEYTQFEEAARLDTEAKDRYTIHTSVIEKQPVFELAMTIATDCLVYGRNIPKTDMVPYGDFVKKASFDVALMVSRFYDQEDRRKAADKIQERIRDFQFGLQVLAEPSVHAVSRNAMAKAMEESNSLYGQVELLAKGGSRKGAEGKVDKGAKADSCATPEAPGDEQQGKPNDE